MKKPKKPKLNNGSSVDKEVKRILLKPMVQRRKGVTDQKELDAALDRLDDRALAEGFLPEIIERLAAARSDKDSKSWKDPDAAREKVSAAWALFASRRISRAEYVYYAAHPVEMIHDSRWTDGDYEELLPIAQAIDAVQEKHGLQPEEYWKIGEGPEQYNKLSNEYSTVLGKRFVKTLREFELGDLADLLEADPDEFARLRERGRRSIFHREEITHALRDIVVRYEEDARRAASVGAYSAAVTLLGAGIEGLLVLRCLRSPKKSARIARNLPNKKPPRFLDDPTTWNFEILIETCLAAGWLSPVSTSVAKYKTATLAHILRRMRNNVHPGRHVRERPWVEINEDDYKDSQAIYDTLRIAVLSRQRRKHLRPNR